MPRYVRRGGKRKGQTGHVCAWDHVHRTKDEAKLCERRLAAPQPPPAASPATPGARP